MDHLGFGGDRACRRGRGLAAASRYPESTEETTSRLGQLRQRAQAVRHLAEQLGELADLRGELSERRRAERLGETVEPGRDGHRRTAHHLHHLVGDPDRAGHLGNRCADRFLDVGEQRVDPRGRLVEVGHRGIEVLDTPQELVDTLAELLERAHRRRQRCREQGEQVSERVVSVLGHGVTLLGAAERLPACGGVGLQRFARTHEMAVALGAVDARHGREVLRRSQSGDREGRQVT